jgi:ATP-dependent Clp protease protease subunit
MENLGKEFKKYASKHIGLNSLTTDDVIGHQIESSMTPMIIEERTMNVISMSVFDRLMKDRQLFLYGTVDARMSSVVNAQLLFLDSIDKKADITLNLNSGGGSVLEGLSMVDVMNYVSCDIATINLGMCASMMSVILSSGKKGKRSALINSKVMVHQVSSGTSGHVDDNRISQMEAEKYNYILFKMLAKNCGKTFDEMYEISPRDKWFNSDQAIKFGLVDEIIGVSDDNNISNMLVGFDEHYQNLLNKQK